MLVSDGCGGMVVVQVIVWWDDSFGLNLTEYADSFCSNIRFHILYGSGIIIKTVKNSEDFSLFSII